jgi:hypothetical protein
LIKIVKQNIKRNTKVIQKREGGGFFKKQKKKRVGDDEIDQVGFI